VTIAVARSSAVIQAESCPTKQTPWLASQLRRAVNTMLWRWRFLSNWTRRAMGMCQPRTFCQAEVAEGMTFVLPGIESESVFTYGICDGLLNGGLRGAVKVFNWGLPFPGGYLANLTRIDRNRRRAADLAAAIMAYQDQYPGRPVWLVAHSGGVGVAVFAAEALPPDRQIDGLVLLSGALSPDYDLRKALSRTKRGILNSYSSKDELVLCWGTSLFGTTDRQFRPACGYAGFSVPADLPPEDRNLYARLKQVAWQRAMADECRHWGGHITSANGDYMARYIAPWMIDSM